MFARSRSLALSTVLALAGVVGVGAAPARAHDHGPGCGHSGHGYDQPRPSSFSLGYERPGFSLGVASGPLGFGPGYRVPGHGYLDYGPGYPIHGRPSCGPRPAPVYGIVPRRPLPPLVNFPAPNWGWPGYYPFPW